MRRCNRFFLGLLLALGLARSAATISQGAGAARSELQFLAEPVVKNIYPLVYASSLRRLMAPSGAMDINRDYEAGKTQTWYIELQGLGTELISAGIAHERLDLVKDGLRALAWGLTQQRDDGGFDCPDAFHSTTTFLESTSRAVLLLSSSPLGSDPFVEKTLTDLRDGLAKTLRWVVEKDRLDHNIKAIQKSLPMRLFLISTSIGQAGKVLGDDMAVARSRQIIRQALSFIGLDGHIPMRGGYDSSYQAVAIIRAMRYRAFIATPAEAKEMAPAVDHAARWLLGRVADDGSLLVAGNTRVGGCTETGRHGYYKKPSFREYAYAVSAYAFAAEKPDLYSVADRILLRRNAVGACERGRPG